MKSSQNLQIRYNLNIFLVFSRHFPVSYVSHIKKGLSVNNVFGSLKYAVCDNSCNCVVQDLHSHFYCEKCHRTFCLEGTHIPVIDLPEGFTLHSINYVLKGICQECSSVGMTLAMK